MYGNFSVVSIGYEQSAPLQIVKEQFTKNNVQEFNVSALLINPVIYNITLQARIFSIYDSRTIIIQKTLILQCPAFYAQLNSDVITQSTDSNYIVSNLSDSFIDIQLLPVQGGMQCYNPVKKTVQNTTINQRLWSQSLVGQTFIQMWNISSDNTSINYRQNIQNPNTFNRVNVKIYYNMIYLTELFINLTYKPLTVLNPNYQSKTFMMNYIQDQTIDIDLSQSIPSDKTYSTVNMQVQCPMELFSSQAQYDRLCIIKNGKFTLRTTSDQGLLIKFNQRYFFNFLLGIDGTSVVRNLQANITFYKNGSGRAQCPSMTLPAKYDYDKVNDQQLEIVPDPYLYCGGIFYELQRSTWSVIDQNSSRQLAIVLNISSAPKLSVYLYNSNQPVKNIMGGSVLILNGIYSFIQANQTDYLANSAVSNLTQTTQVVFKKNPLQPQIIVHNYNKDVLKPQGLDFLEPNITLNASTSYDPDNTSAVLDYDWKCPADIGEANCKSLLFGPRNNSLVIPLTKKFSLGLKYNTIYTFTLVLSTKDNPYKEFQSTFVPISFSLPQKEEVAVGDIRNTSCEQVNIDGEDIDDWDDELQARVIEYTKNDWNQIDFDVTALIDNGQNGARSPCGFGNIEEQYVFFYMFDGLLPTNTVPQQLLFQNANNATKRQTLNVKFDRYFNLPSMTRNIPLKTTVYMITRRQGSTRVFINQQNVYLIRRYAALVPVLRETSIKLDQYQNLILNASSSFDSEDTSNRNLKFQWICPNSLQVCKNNQGSIMNVTYEERLKAGINNVQSIATYGVQVQSEQRNSQFLQADVTITKRDDYTNCIFATLSNNQVQNDFEADNRTLYLEYNQTANIVAQMTVQFKCDNIFSYTPQWRSFDPTMQQFWTLDKSDPNKIQISSEQIRSMRAGKTNTVLYQQQIHMGFDASTKFQYQTYLNLFLNKPDLIPRVSGTFVAVYGTDPLIKLDASKSVDPLNEGFSCVWDCPGYLGGARCSEKCQWELVYEDIKNFIGRNPISYYLDQAHGLNLTVISSDNQRTSVTTQYIYLSSGQRNPFNQTGISNCKLQIYGYDKFQISQTNVIYFGCNNYDNLTSLMISPFYFNNKWEIQGLQSGLDYYNASGQLFIKPYALSKLQQNQVLITLNITQIPGKIIPLYIAPVIINNSTNSTDNSTNSTNSSSSNQSQPVTPTPPQMNSNRFSFDTRIKVQFQIRREILLPGIKITFSNKDQLAYTTLFSFVFEGVKSTTKSSLMFQLRSYQEIYKANHLVIPQKPFTKENIQLFYTNTYLPLATLFYVDFFDVNLNYVGSYEFKNQILNNMDMGTYQFTVYSRNLYAIQTKQIDQYPNTFQGKADYERDSKRLLELTEMLTLNAIYGTLDVVYNSYANQILAYLRITFKQAIAMYDASNLYEARQKYCIQKRVLLIFYNLINRNSGIQDRVLSVLDVVTTATADFEQLSLSGEDSEFMRTVVLYLRQVLNTELVDQKLTNKDSFFDKIYNITSNVYESDVVRDQTSNQKISMFTTDKLSRIIYRLTKGSNQSISLESQLNPNEKIDFVSEQLLEKLNVTSLNIQFDTDTLSSPAVSTSTTINAFNAANEKVEVSFMRFYEAYFGVQLQLNQQAIQLLQNTSTTNSSYRAKCVYYETSQNKWIDRGMEVAFVDTQNGLIKCKSYHLSQFSVQYYQVQAAVEEPVTPTPGPWTPSPPPKKDEEKKGTEQKQTEMGMVSYYKINEGSYAGAIIVPLIGVLVFISIGFCCKYKGMKEGKLETYQKQSYCKLLWTLLKIYHPLFSAFTRLNQPILALPFVYQQLSFWIYVFGIVTCTLIDMIYISNYTYTGARVAAFAAIYWLCLLLTRPLLNKIRFGMYFNYASVEVVQPNQNHQRSRSYQLEPERPSTINQPYQDSQMRFMVGDDGLGHQFEGGGLSQRDLELQFEGGSSSMDSEEFKDDEDFSESSQRGKDRPAKIASSALYGTKQPSVLPNGLVTIDLDSQGSQHHQQAVYHRKNIKSNTSSQQPQLSFTTDMNKKRFEETTILNKQDTNLIPYDESGDDGKLQQQIPKGKKLDDFLAIADKQDTTPVETEQSARGGAEAGKHIIVDEIKLDFRSPDKKAEDLKTSSPPQTSKRDGPPGATIAAQDYDVPDKKLRSVKERQTALNSEDFEYTVSVKNEHNYKGTRMVLLIILMAILVVEFIITFSVMKEIKDQQQLGYWIQAVIALIAFFLVYDLLMAMIYACVFTRTKNKIDNNFIAGALLLGNPDIRARYSLLFELKQ